ncbi:hypothetical protein C8R44DRAFT_730290 [Mycena epipterygia]|nr:hypothetical protein C8R44DRAFT_730290 [Mycena epipterygia]
MKCAELALRPAGPGVAGGEECHSERAPTRFRLANAGREGRSFDATRSDTHGVCLYDGEPSGGSRGGGAGAGASGGEGEGGLRRRRRRRIRAPGQQRREVYGARRWHCIRKKTQRNTKYTSYSWRGPGRCGYYRDVVGADGARFGLRIGRETKTHSRPTNLFGDVHGGCVDLGVVVAIFSRMSTASVLGSGSIAAYFISKIPSLVASFLPPPKLSPRSTPAAAFIRTALRISAPSTMIPDTTAQLFHLSSEHFHEVWQFPSAFHVIILTHLGFKARLDGGGTAPALRTVVGLVA